MYERKYGPQCKRYSVLTILSDKTSDFLPRKLWGVSGMKLRKWATKCVYGKLDWFHQAHKVNECLRGRSAQRVGTASTHNAVGVGWDWVLGYTRSNHGSRLALWWEFGLLPRNDVESIFLGIDGGTCPYIFPSHIRTLWPCLKGCFGKSCLLCQEVICKQFDDFGHLVNVSTNTPHHITRCRRNGFRTHVTYTLQETYEGLIINFAVGPSKPCSPLSA